jgi:hypothetical protein
MGERKDIKKGVDHNSVSVDSTKAPSTTKALKKRKGHPDVDEEEVSCHHQSEMSCVTFCLQKLKLDHCKVASAEALTSNFGACTTAQAEATRENVAWVKHEEKQRLIDQHMIYVQNLLNSPDPVMQQWAHQLMAHLDVFQQDLENEQFRHS